MWLWLRRIYLSLRISGIRRRLRANSFSAEAKLYNPIQGGWNGEIQSPRKDEVCKTELFLLCNLWSSITSLFTLVGGKGGKLLFVLFCFFTKQSICRLVEVVLRRFQNFTTRTSWSLLLTVHITMTVKYLVPRTCQGSDYLKSALVQLRAE